MSEIPAALAPRPKRAKLARSHARRLAAWRAKTARERRLFALLAAGATIADVAYAERLSPRRAREIVQAALGRRGGDIARNRLKRRRLGANRRRVTPLAALRRWRRRTATWRRRR
jgi:hypothetical protein